MRPQRLCIGCFALLGVALSLWAGCGSGPFQITGPPAEERPLGFALVTADVPSYIRGVIRRVRVQVTTADTSRMQPVVREMNFPIPGGSLAAGEVADIPTGRRLFTVTAYDTEEALRFRGSGMDSVRTGQATTMRIPLYRIGGTLRFTATLTKSQVADSLASILASTSVLDIVELGANRDLPRLAIASTPVVSFTRDGQGYSRQVTISQIPTGNRLFAGSLRDLSRGGRYIVFTDTVSAKVDTSAVGDVAFTLKRVDRLLRDSEIVLPADSTVVVVSPNF
jgi:hypothetical protein